MKIIGPLIQYFKIRQNAVQVYLPYGFTLWDPTSLKCLLQNETVKSGRKIADCCKIIVGLVKMSNGNVKILNCKIKLLNNVRKL
jgi:hypothetical protein